MSIFCTSKIIVANFGRDTDYLKLIETLEGFFCKKASFFNSGCVVDLQVLVKELVLDSAVVDIVLETLGMFGKMKLLVASFWEAMSMLSLFPMVGLDSIIMITTKRNE